MRWTAVCVAALAACAYAIPVDNEVLDEPEIECGATSITVTINSRNNFEGHTYVKNRFAEDGCRVTADGNNPSNTIQLEHDACGTVRRRSAEPKGIFMSMTIVHSFHPRFLTKVDRAYTIQCFYMEADKTVSTDIEVSMITTGFQTQFVPMPICRYQILESGDPESNPVQFAIIGQPVWHHWICDTDTVDTFCMTVHSCYVDDGAGDRLDLVNPEGCSFDRYLLGHVEYPEDLRAAKEVHVFKYADRPALRFQCQITIDVKEPNGECPRPDCDPQIQGGGDGDGQPSFPRRKRAADSVAEMDVSSQTFETLDITPRLDEAHLPFFAHEGAARVAAENTGYIRYMPGTVARADGVCMSPSVFAAGLGAVVVVVIAAAVLVVKRGADKH